MFEDRKSYTPEFIRQCLEEAKAEVDAGRSGWAIRVSENYQMPKATLLGWWRRFDGDPDKVPVNGTAGMAPRTPEKKTRRAYSPEFVAAAVKKFETRGDKSAAEVANQIGINVGMLGRWAREARQRELGGTSAPAESQPLPMVQIPFIHHPDKLRADLRMKARLTVSRAGVESAEIHSPKIAILVDRYIELLESESELLRGKLGMAS